MYYIGYIPKKTSIKDILLKYWYFLKDDPKLNEVFNKEPLITYKRASNIRNRFVKVCSINKLLLKGQVSLGNFKCGNCVNCKFTFFLTFFNNSDDKSPIFYQEFYKM